MFKQFVAHFFSSPGALADRVKFIRQRLPLWASWLTQSPAQVVAPAYVYSTALYLHTEVEIKKSSEFITYSEQKVFNNTGNDCVRRVFWIESGRRTLSGNSQKNKCI